MKADLSGCTGDLTLYANFIQNAGNISADVSFYENPDSDIEVTETINGAYVTFTAPAGYASYKWYFKGVEQTALTDNSATFNTTGLASGYYDVMLIVSDNIGYYSWSGTITVN